MTETPVVLDQALFGYRDGHRLISGSKRFSAPTERALLRLSDMSGPRMISGFEEYLTGYPLPEDASYALIKTWYAPEMERPGCVWSHVLVIKNSDLRWIRTAQQLLRLFKQPSMPADQGYSAPITLSQSKWLARDGLQLGMAKVQLACVLDRLYMKPAAAVIIAASSASELTNVVLSIWAQQWPALRSSFRFCTGSLGNRITAERFFDLQVVPARIVHELERNLKDVEVLRDFNSVASFDAWESIAQEDHFLAGAADYREFLWHYADPCTPGRALFAPLSQLYVLIKQGIGKISEITPVISQIYPSFDAGKTLKKDFYGQSQNPPNPNLVIGNFGEVEKLRELSQTIYAAAFDAVDLELRDRARFLWMNDRSGAEEILLTALDSPQQAANDAIIAGFMDAIKPAEAWELAGRRGGVPLAIVARNARLLRTVEFWNSRVAHSLFLDVLDLVKSDLSKSTTVSDWLPAVVESGREDLAPPIMQRFGGVAVPAFLNLYRSREINVPWPPSGAWRSAVSPFEAEILGWARREAVLPPRALVLLTTILDSHSLPVTALGTDFWSSLVVGEPSLIQEIPNAESAAFLLSLGLQTFGPSAGPFLAPTFEVVHEAAGVDNLSYRGWQMLKVDVPSLGMLRNWDKCERLRIALLRHFDWSQLSIDDFFNAVTRSETLRALIFTARDVDEGERFVIRMAAAVLSGEYKAPDDQAVIISKYVHKTRKGHLKISV